MSWWVSHSGVEWVLLAGAAVAMGGFVLGRRQRTRRQADDPADLALLQRVLGEDVTALGEDLQQLDRDLAGEELDEGHGRSSSARSTRTTGRRTP